MDVRAVGDTHGQVADYDPAALEAIYVLLAGQLPPLGVAVVRPVRLTLRQAQGEPAGVVSWGEGVRVVSLGEWIWVFSLAETGDDLFGEELHGVDNLLVGDAAAHFEPEQHLADGEL